MSEVPLKSIWGHHSGEMELGITVWSLGSFCFSRAFLTPGLFRGTAFIRKCPFPWTAVGS
jgi:hypothetical protein